MAENFSQNELNAQRHMENLVKESRIFMDTCSIIDAKILFWEHIKPYLRKYDKKIIIPYRCYEELVKKTRDSQNQELQKTANERLLFLKQLEDDSFIKIRGEKSDNFADNVFLSVFTKFRLQYNLLLITQDNNLARDILNLNNSTSQKSTHIIKVRRVNEYNYLGKFSWDKIPKNQGDSGKKSVKPSTTVIETETAPQEDIFNICTKVTTISDDIVQVSHIPTQNEVVYTEQHAELKLLNKIAAGGEGILYETNTPFVAKVYFKDKNTKRRIEKIKLMLTKKVDCKGVCYPVAALYNKEKQFIGYLMPKATGTELQKSLFIKPLFLKRFPNWKKKDTVKLCITILEKIKYLHDRNIILGDINPNNIIINSPSDVYFVDTDSYQIEDFPCPVGTINFTAPEIQRKPFNDFLRTIGNENFAVATLLFMIMLPGKPPYSQQGGENPVDNIIKMDFSYPFGDSSNKKTPDGPWRFIWSHLTYDIKKAFYTTFKKGEEHSTEQTRLSEKEWLSLFEYYLKLLETGKFGEQDKMSEELFPTRHKKNPKLNYIKCRLCHNEMPEEQCQNGICQSCLKTGEEYKCKRCGKSLLYTNYAKYIKNAKRFDMCQDCFENMNSVHSYIICSNCKKRFSITNGEYEFFINKGLSLPKKCKECRKNKTNVTPSPTWYNQTVSQSHNSSGSSGCFITTAVCDYFGKNDDCEELTILRQYRDSWLQFQENGKELISEYYKRAPIIVSRLKASDKYSFYCQMLYDRYLLPCIELIKAKKFKDCQQLYQKMVTDISNLLAI